MGCPTENVSDQIGCNINCVSNLNFFSGVC